MTIGYVALGSNLGDRQSNIARAISLIPDISRTSDIIETQPLAGSDQPGYLNSVAEIQTDLSAEKLFKKLIEIENTLGRTRDKKWSPRTIDLDLLLFDDEIIDTPDLIVPHPQMHLRSFVLKPLAQLNPDAKHPLLNRSIETLAKRLNGHDFFLNPSLPQLISIAGIIGVGKTTLAKNLTDTIGCQLLLEDYDKNPFMPLVYNGNTDLALDSQLYFLNSRLAQLDINNLSPGQPVITDYIFEKELIYAKKLLNNDQFISYEKLNRSHSGCVAAAQLIIYLTDTAENCLNRIRNRNRPYEQKIDSQFLNSLIADYDSLLANWTACPMIHLCVSGFNCTEPGQIKNLANEIKYYIAIDK